LDAKKLRAFHFVPSWDGLDCGKLGHMVPDVKTGSQEYIDSLPRIRRDRLSELKERFERAVPEVQLTMRYKMPTFERGDHWACLGNQKHHISIYFCSEAINAPVVANNPKLNCGKGCVRIRDTQEVPIEDLVDAYRRAMGLA